LLQYYSPRSSNVSLMTDLDISLLTMDNESAFEDHFKLENYREGHRENCCYKNVSSSRFASLEIEYEDRTFLGSTMRTQEIGCFWLVSRPASLEVAVKVVIAGRRGVAQGRSNCEERLPVTILRTAGRYMDRMRDVLACVVCYVSATKDALLSRLRA